MTHYQVTIGYKGIYIINVHAESEKDAKDLAIEIMSKQRDKMANRKGVELQDDSFKPDGILNMDETWNMIY